MNQRVQGLIWSRHRGDALPTKPHAMIEKARLRKQMREKRNALNRQQVAVLSHRVCRRLKAFTAFRNATRIACYASLPAEVSLKPLTEHALRCDKTLFIPTIDPIRRGKMRFTKLERVQRYKKNRLGIMETVSQDSAPCWTMDLVLMPLLAFDRNGGRLGMGGGFYDRAFGNRLAAHCTLVGIAFDFQEAEELPTETWDLKLNYVVTNREIITCKKEA